MKKGNYKERRNKRKEVEEKSRKVRKGRGNEDKIEETKTTL